MIKNLKISAIIYCLFLGIYVIGSPARPIVQLDSTSQAKTIIISSQIQLTGMLVLVNKEYALQDSTGSIKLVFNNKTHDLNEKIGKIVTITGFIMEHEYGKTELFIKVFDIKTLEKTEGSADTSLNINHL
ncbi:MAG: OB-fold nucleic acid binding domain-containing protein [Candidatus Woesearchaeota archaeon]